MVNSSDLTLKPRLFILKVPISTVYTRDFGHSRWSPMSSRTPQPLFSWLERMMLNHRFLFFGRMWINLHDIGFTLFCFFCRWSKGHCDTRRLFEFFIGRLLDQLKCHWLCSDAKILYSHAFSVIQVLFLIRLSLIRLTIMCFCSCAITLHVALRGPRLLLVETKSFTLAGNGVV